MGLCIQWKGETTTQELKASEELDKHLKKRRYN